VSPQSTNFVVFFGIESSPFVISSFRNPY